MQARLQNAFYALLLAILMVNASAALAQKKGGAGSNGGGTIYYWYESNVYSMLDDGSQKTLLPGLAGLGPQADPSWLKHGGKRWFVDWDADWNATFPDGNPRDIFAARSDTGDSVTWPMPGSIQMLNSPPRWRPGDNFVSWVGRTWDINTGTVVDGGVYVGAVSWNAQGVVGFSSVTLLVSFPLVLADPNGPGPFGLVPDVRSHDWASDGTRFVYENDARDAINACDLATGTASMVYADPVQRVASPRWSPNAEKNMFNHFTGWIEVDVINVDGSGYKKVVGSSPNWSNSAGCWSPTGSHLLYNHRDHFIQDSYIMRVKASGSGGARLTGPEIGSGYSFPRTMGWR